LAAILMQPSQSRELEEVAATLLKTSEVSSAGLRWRRQACHPNMAALAMACLTGGWEVLRLTSLMTKVSRSPIFYLGSLLMGSTTEHSAPQ
jgi:hypothetical protein